MKELKSRALNRVSPGLASQKVMETIQEIGGIRDTKDEYPVRLETSPDLAKYQ